MLTRSAAEDARRFLSAGDTKILPQQGRPMRNTDAFKTTSRALPRCFMARLFAARSLAVFMGEPSATFSAFQPSRPPSAFKARLKSGSLR